MNKDVIIMEEYRKKIRAQQEAEYIRLMRDPINHGQTFHPGESDSKKEKKNTR